MDIEKALVSEAEQIASNMDSRARALEEELGEIEHRKMHVEAELNAAKLSHKRLPSFQARIGRNFQCPRCWVRDETRFKIRPIPSCGDNDVLRCDRCGSDWAILYR